MLVQDVAVDCVRMLGGETKGAGTLQTPMGGRTYDSQGLGSRENKKVCVSSARASLKDVCIHEAEWLCSRHFILRPRGNVHHMSSFGGLCV